MLRARAKITLDPKPKANTSPGKKYLEDARTRNLNRGFGSPGRFLGETQSLDYDLKNSCLARVELPFGIYSPS